MKGLLLSIFTMTALSATAQNGRATTVKKTFSRTTTISQIIQAEPEIVWSLLTNAQDFSRWNSTIVSLSGEINEGNKIELVSSLDSSRTFKLKVIEVIPNQKLVWGDALGKRVYSLTRQGEATIFTMTEKIGGPMFPLFAGKIPSFDASFEQFTSDLKQEAETITQTK
jgi:uncharacterized protein YndB with AHSA1/START domain